MSKQTDLINIPDAITVDGSNNVGIGVVPKTWNVYDQAVQIGDGAAIWTYQNAEAHYSVNSYYNSGNKYIGTGTALQYQQAAGAHSFKTATSGTADAAISWNTKVDIDSDGLKFNGDTAAANALNDYEEGTWTPTLLGASSNPTVGYLLQTGHYTKIGNTVNLYCRLQTNSRSGGSGTALIGGLPFAHNSARAGGSLGYISGVNLGSGFAQFSLSGDPVSSTIRYVQSGDNVGSNIINVTEVGSTHDVVFTYTYQTNS
jgi:hypothetical protein